MTDLACDKLHVFVDGELGEDEAERFRDHLASCERCAAEMPRLLELIAACEELAEAAPPAELAVASASPPIAVAPPPIAAAPRPIATARRSRWRRVGYVASAGAVAVAAVLAVVLFRQTEPGTSEVAFADLSPSRKVEVRLSYAGAAGYRPYEVSRGDVAREDLSFELMAALKRAGDWHGLGVASLLRGDRVGAARYLEQAGRSTSADIDRAALELLDGSDAAIERALILLDAALVAEPDNMVAHWNRALALARLDLPLAAAREFDRVAAAGEPGWSAEASQRARAQRTKIEPRRGASDAVNKAGNAWIAGDDPIAPPPADAPRGLYRALFYDAVRAAGSRARVEALLPLARRLDALYGGDVLVRYADSVAAADFRVRAPLAASFRAVTLDSATPDEAIGKLATQMHDAAVRDPRMIDIWMGLVGNTATIGQHLADFRSAADATADPWFVVMAEHEQAKHEIAAGDRLEGERRLLRAEDLATRDELGYRRLLVELSLSKLYLTLRRFPEAERRAREALAEARTAGEWELEQALVYQLAEAVRFRYSFALSRAYLAEALERDPETCRVRRYVHQSLANLAMLELDPVTARREVAATPACGEPLKLLTAVTRADLYRFGGTDAEAKQLREGLAALRAGGSLDTGTLALVDHIEGRLVIEIDRPAGRALLRKAITEVASRGDDSSTKARAFSFSILALDAGRAGEHDTVLSLLAEEQGGSAPPRCAIGIAVEDERAIVVARGPDGATAGDYTGRRSSARIDAGSLIPAALVHRLDGCAEVSVLARPPLLGAARLLPETIAWSYRLNGSAARLATGAPGPHLVVADTDPPAHLDLPRLLPYVGGAPDEVVLRGTGATPAEVISAMRDASVIEFHTHGFIDRGLSDASYLALSPDRAGRYALTAADVGASELRGAPVVILAACHAAAGAPFLDEGVGLPLAFIRAKARAVIASPTAVDDIGAGAFFHGVLARIAGGSSPAIAVRDQRMSRSPGSSSWTSDVIVYQ